MTVEQIEQAHQLIKQAIALLSDIDAAQVADAETAEICEEKLTQLELTVSNFEPITYALLEEWAIAHGPES